MRIRFLMLAASILMSAAFAAGQQWPSEIRGYKLYDAGIVIDGSRKSGGKLKATGFKTIDFGLTGATFEVDAEVTSIKQGGDIDFVTFHGFQVNAVPVEIEEYKHKFQIRKGVPTALPNAARVNIRGINIPLAAYRELLTQDQVTVTGTAFVFGKFKKLFFNFRRVVPVKVNVKISNPLKSLR